MEAEYGGDREYREARPEPMAAASRGVNWLGMHWAVLWEALWPRGAGLGRFGGMLSQELQPRGTTAYLEHQQPSLEATQELGMGKAAVPMLWFPWDEAQVPGGMKDNFRWCTGNIFSSVVQSLFSRSFGKCDWHIKAVVSQVLLLFRIRQVKAVSHLR